MKTCLLLMLRKEGTLSVAKVEELLQGLFRLEGDHLCFKVGSIEYWIEYSLKRMDRVVEIEVISNLSPVKSAMVLDAFVTRLISGEHRKDYNIIISYDEASLEFCIKLMKPLGTFERLIRELVYITVSKAYGTSWYQKTVDSHQKNELSKHNEQKMIESALQELSYAQLIDYLFAKRFFVDIDDLLDVKLSDEALSRLSKEQIARIIREARRTSLWNMLFSKYRDLAELENQIDQIRFKRNQVMHHKRIRYAEYLETRRVLTEAISKLKESIYLAKDHKYSNVQTFNILSTLCSLSEIMTSFVNQLDITPMVDAANRALSSIKDSMPDLEKMKANIIQFQKNYNVILENNEME